MEILIVICLLIVIILLVKDKVSFKSPSKKKDLPPTQHRALPEIMGTPKPKKRFVATVAATEELIDNPVDDVDGSDITNESKGFRINVLKEVQDKTFDNSLNLEAEEEEWSNYGEPNGDDGFAIGVTFEELATVGALLDRSSLEPNLKEQAVDIVQRIQGTELFSLLENSVENVAQKIASLLDGAITKGADSDSYPKQDKNIDDFDIGKFV